MKKLSRLILKKLARKGGGMRPFCSAVVVAAGSASRMQGTDKIFTPLGKRPVIAWTLQAFQDCGDVDEVILVVRPDSIPQAAGICAQYGFEKVTKVVAGGSTRAESVLNGAAAVSQRARLLAIHDGARPLVTAQLIGDVVKKAAETRAAIAAVPCVDTIKIQREGFITATPDRNTLVSVQTPQVFDADLIKGILTRAVEEKWPITDDASAAERCGVKVAVSTGSYDNIKITTPTDMVVAAGILARRGVL